MGLEVAARLCFVIGQRDCGENGGDEEHCAPGDEVCPAVGEFVDLLRVKRQRVEEGLQFEQDIGRKEEVKNGTGQGQEHGEKSRQRTEEGG